MSEALFAAAQSGDAGTLAALLDADAAGLEARRGAYAMTLLHDAALGGHLAVVEELLRRGLDVNARERGDHTYAMHWAAAEGHLDVVQALADAGGDVIGRGDDHGLEVIGWAACWDPHTEVAEFLVARGARHHIFSAIALDLAGELRRIVAENPGALNRRMSCTEDHQLPLQFAVHKGQAEMVALLVELGADPLCVDASGHTAAAYATEPDVDRPVMEAIHALTAGELLSAERGARAPKLRAHDLLAALALHDFETAAKVAIEPGALHVMAKRGDLAAVNWLLEHGADADASWSHWDAEVTPLHLAAAHGHVDVVRALLAAGADPSIRDSMHDSDPLGWATFFHQPAVVALLAPGPSAETVNVVLEFGERDPHVREIFEAFDDGWTVGITSRTGVVRLELKTPGATWSAAVSLVEGRLERLPFDWRSHATCRRP